MKASDVFPPATLRAADIAGRDPIVTIDKVTVWDFDGERKPLIHFRAAREKATKQAKDRAVSRQVSQHVAARDGRKCRACAKAVDMTSPDLLKRGHLHHIRYRSRGGQDDPANLVTLCAICHADVHAHRLTVTGNAESSLTFAREEKVWHG